jgi:ATP-dependent DNA helicase RecQ
MAPVDDPAAPDSGALEAVLRRYWGFDGFRPLQREAMETIVAGRDSVLVLPTGAGKSLCFQAPAMLGAPGDGLALVVSPLIALMKDQVDGLVESGIPAARVDSSMTPDARADVTAGIAQRRFRLLYVSPERLVGPGGDTFTRQLTRAGVRFVAIDEAHCISHWGHDFRPEYRQLGALRATFPDASFHAFTATATERVRHDIVERLGLQDPAVLVGDFDRPNLIYRVRPRAAARKQVEEIIRARPGQAGILYCISRREVDALAASLAESGVRVRPYHAGLSDDERTRHQDAFVNEEIDIIVATVAFGMGVDRSDVRFVVHVGAPKSVEHYQQESGRAGRDGLEAECVLLFSPADMLKWRRIMEATGELGEEAVERLRAMEAYAAGMHCRHRALVRHFGQRYDRDDCGACDWCLRELEQIDEALVTAQKVVSCVARVRQRFGVAHVSAVLEGRTTPQVKAQQHDRLSTFGLLAGTPTAEVRGYIDQLVSAGFLARSAGEYPVLSITARGGALLKGQVEASDVVLCRQPRVPARGDRRAPVSRVERESWEGVDRDLFERLRELRLSIARSRGVPPYVIFHDRTLREMARVKPASLDEIATIYGVGARKADAYGPAFLEAIRPA